jgi:hypothetical protein
MFVLNYCSTNEKTEQTDVAVGASDDSHEMWQDRKAFRAMTLTENFMKIGLAVFIML